MDHAAARVGDGLHLVVREVLVAAGLGHEERVRGHHAGDVLEDLAAFGAERRGQRHGRGVAAAAAEGRDLSRAADALEAGDDDDVARLEGFAHAVGADLEDARVGVAVVGDDAALAAGEGDGGAVLGRERHAEQRHRDPLADRQQHVELAAGRVGIGAAGQGQQVVGGAAHGADDHDEARAARAAIAQVAGDLAQPRQVGKAGAAVLANQDGR